PRVPNFASHLDPDIVQLHSSQYRNPFQLREGPVLLVGASNSGAEIGLELASRHETWLSGRHPGHIPFRIEGRLAHRIFIPFVIGFLFHYVFTTSTPIGRRMRAKLLSQGGLLVRVKPEDLRDAGIRRVPRTTAVRDGLPVLADGRTLEVANVIWCTGYRPSFSWIDLPVFGGQEDPHEPVHQRGVVPQEPGLYFVGLHFLYAHSSTLIRGAGRDAEHVVQHLVSRMR
ncbi:MAG: hypothetical protein R3300_17320, partial [Candidatus Promineifilaceae bacterium]|nr:hypothetical protein [Candidatus Promineifilaceae bacterium]